LDSWIEAADVDAEIKKILEMLPGKRLPSREEFNEYMKVEKLLNFIEYLKGLSQKSSQYSAWKKEIIDLEAKEISFKKRLEDAKAEARKSGVKPGEVAKLEANVEHFTRKHASVQTNLERLRQDRDLKSKELRDIIADLSKYSKMSENEEKYARKALALKELFEELVHRHEKDKIAKISSKAQELFLTIIEKPELFTGLELTEDYDIKLHELYHPKGEIPTTRPSTGETDVMYVSVALALNMESGNRMIILDDATINLDNKYTKKVLDAINQFGFEQVVMICKDTIKDLVLTRLDSSRAYAVQYDKLKQTSVITRIVGG
jgi:DNA sulfur modification protein DndD